MTASAFASPLVTPVNSATALANAIAGPGITITNATLNGGGGTQSTGTFTNGAATIGFGSGIVLTTGTTDCVAGPNSTSFCDTRPPGVSPAVTIGTVTGSTLAFDFTSTSGQVFFQYVFASEEYNEFVRFGFNDNFELLLNSVNIATLPNGGGVVSIDNVNCGSNAGFYRNNSPFGLDRPDGTPGSSVACPTPPSLLDLQYDGLTTVLTAIATVNAGTNRFEFRVRDGGDLNLDSAVFVRAGSFSAVNQNPPTGGQVPEPGSLALMALALAGLGLARRRSA